MNPHSDTKLDYCHDHGGWGGEGIPCKVCGVVGKPNLMPPIPSGLSFDQALQWGAEQINRQILSHD
jgi:hypothetical protein